MSEQTTEPEPDDEPDVEPEQPAPEPAPSEEIPPLTDQPPGDVIRALGFDPAQVATVIISATGVRAISRTLVEPPTDPPAGDPEPEPDPDPEATEPEPTEPEPDPAPAEPAPEPEPTDPTEPADGGSDDTPEVPNADA